MDSSGSGYKNIGLLSMPELNAMCQKRLGFHD